LRLQFGLANDKELLGEVGFVEELGEAVDTGAGAVGAGSGFLPSGLHRRLAQTGWLWSVHTEVGGLLCCGSKFGRRLRLWGVNGVTGLAASPYSRSQPNAHSLSIAGGIFKWWWRLLARLGLALGKWSCEAGTLRDEDRRVGRVGQTLHSYC